MSYIKETNFDPNDPIHYAPRHVRFNRHDNVSQIRDLNVEPLRPVEQTAWQEVDPPETPEQDQPPLRQRSQIFEDAVSRALREAREPQEVYTPSMDREAHKGGTAVFVRFGAVIAAAALLAAFFVTVVPMLRGTESKTETAAEGPSVWRQLKTSLFPAPARKPSASTLAFEDQIGDNNDTLPLGVSVTAPPPGSVIVLSGLPAGSRLSSGKKVSANDWRVPAQEIANVAVTPPMDFTGQVAINAELRNADGAALVGGTFRMTWNRSGVGTGAASRPAAAVPPTAGQIVIPQVPSTTVAALPGGFGAQPQQPAAPTTTATRSLDPNEIAGMIKRAYDLIAGGDIVPARLLLQRAAESRSAQAAMLLAESYDPVVLRRMRNGPMPDVEQARRWYRKAADWGAPDAQRQLDALQTY